MKEKQINKGDEIEKVEAVSYYLIGQCVETNAEKMRLEYLNVSRAGKPLGSWEIIVRKIS